MIKKLLLIVIINILLIYAGTAFVYSHNQKYKGNIPRDLLEQVMIDNDPETYTKYKGNPYKLSKAVKSDKQDLNGDNKPEYIMVGNSPFVCGSGGCQLWIYQKDLKTNKYQAIHPIDAQSVLLRNSKVKVMKTTTNGYFDLECFEGSLNDKEQVILKFNGQRYTRN